MLDKGTYSGRGKRKNSSQPTISMNGRELTIEEFREELSEPGRIPDLGLGEEPLAQDDEPHVARLRAPEAVDEKATEPLVSENVKAPVPSVDRWEPRTFQDAMKGSGVRPPWIVEDLLLSDSATLVSAQPHAIKSLSLLEACLEALTTKKVWGHFPAPNVDSVLFLETEDPPWLVESRIRGFAKGLGFKENDRVDGFHYACVGPFDFVKEAESGLYRLVEKCKPDFLVISTLQNLLMGRDWKSTRRDAARDGRHA